MDTIINKDFKKKINHEDQFQKLNTMTVCLNLKANTNYDFIPTIMT